MSEESIQRGSRWEHTTYPGSFDLTVLNVVDGQNYLAERMHTQEQMLCRVNGPFAEVRFAHGAYSFIRTDLLHRFFREVA